MRFWWTELLSFFEFKVIHKELSLPTSEDLDGVTRDRSLSTFIAGFPSFFRAFMTAVVPLIANSLVRAPPITPQPSDELTFNNGHPLPGRPSHFSFGSKRSSDAILQMCPTYQRGERWTVLHLIYLCCSAPATPGDAIPWWPAESCHRCTCDRRHHPTFILRPFDYYRIGTS
jgi:hypothetical protein